MTIEQYHICRREIEFVTSRKDFISRFPGVDPGELVDAWTILHDYSIATVRALSGLTQDDFAKRYGISLTTVQAWTLSPSSANRRNIQPYVLDLLAVDVINTRAAEKI